MEQLTVIANGYYPEGIRKEVDTRAAEGWTLYRIDTLNRNDDVIMTFRRYPLALSPEALAYLAACPDSAIAEEASRLIIMALHS